MDSFRLGLDVQTAKFVSLCIRLRLHMEEYYLRLGDYLHKRKIPVRKRRHSEEPLTDPAPPKRPRNNSDREWAGVRVSCRILLTQFYSD
jgi:hypothetical protein